MSASQAENVGSIPITRLKFLVHGIRPPTSLQTTAGQVVTATD